MGAVYLAHDTQLDRPVALKVPSFGPEEDSTLRDRFYREARAAATLQHPSICPVYDVGEIDDKLYLTMAYIEGKPLSQILKERGKALPLDEAAELVRKLAEAMDEAHTRDVIHRDLKPTNILVNRRGDPVLIDFGLARREGKNDARLTATGAILGTPAYMAPELASGHASIAGRSCDVYSLGVILYELVTGSIPFRGTLGQVLGMILNQEPMPVRQRRPDADERIEAICRKAMAKKPEERFASMGDFSKALSDYLRNLRS
jgi:serine/threonine protein kinase